MHEHNGNFTFWLSGLAVLLWSGFAPGQESNAVATKELPEAHLQAVPANRCDLAKVMTGLEKTMPPAQWSVARQPWTADMVRQVGAMFQETERAKHVVRGWKEGHALVWTAKGGNLERQVAVSVARFEAPAGARAYQGFAVDLQRKRDQRLQAACAPGQKVSESRTRTVSIPHSEETIFFEKQLEFSPGKTTTTLSMLLVRAGGLVIEINWFGTPADMAWAARVVEQIAAARNDKVTR